MLENLTNTDIADYVILPLYSVRTNQVPLKSGLNQWNAEGRVRDPDEVYIPVPMEIHDKKPNFFPSLEENFILYLPDGLRLSAKMCQAGRKGLMSNPNRDLGKWILRDVLKKHRREIVTLADLINAGADCVKVEKFKSRSRNGFLQYRISYSSQYESYDSFIRKI